MCIIWVGKGKSILIYRVKAGGQIRRQLGGAVRLSKKTVKEAIKEAVKEAVEVV